jgi:cytochrome c oxidase subunit 2
VQKWWSILFAVVNLAALGLFVIAPSMGWWLPKDVSVDGFGSQVDWLFYLILAITGFFFVLTEAILVYNMWRFAAQPGRKSEYTHGNHTLEWVWTIIPAGILIFIAFAQVRAWEKIKYVSRMPDPTHLVEVSARQFEWRVRYPKADSLKTLVESWKTAPQVAKAWDEQGYIDDVHVVNELHTWVGAKVRVYLKTRDVLHSFFLPNMRLKQDALPGKTIPVWFEAKEANIVWDADKKSWVNPTGSDKPLEEWELACAELCGWGHYKMQGRLWVHKDRADYDEWLKQAEALQNQREAAKK